MTETNHTAGMKPIWYFVGWMLLIIGLIVTLTGLYNFVQPPAIQPVLHDLHTDIWWGAVITAGGLVLLLRNRNATI